MSKDGNKLQGVRVQSKDVTLKRGKKKPARFSAKIRVSESGAPGQLVMVRTVESPTRMTGTNKLTFDVGGQTCVITRSFDMRHQGK